MGQKVNPISMRLGINRTWDSTWYAGKNEYSILLKEDLNMRKMIFKDLKNAAEKINLKDLSMGMSSDFEKATINGSTYLRIGSAILGERKVI